MSYPPSLQELQEQFPAFKVLREIKQGGQKTAFEVRRKSNGERLVLKIFAPGANPERIDRDVQAMTTIRSPFIVHLVEFQKLITEQQIIIYTLEEFIEGRDLAWRLESGDPFSPHEAAVFLDKMLQGLEACWEKRIVHRDIKPDNILLRANGDPVIIDFGICRLVDATSITRTSAPHGPRTKLYAPPEMIQNQKGDIDNRSDLYSLGVTVYHLLTERHPFWSPNEDPSVGEGRMLDASFEPVSPHKIKPEISEEMSKYILRLMSCLRHRRPKNATVAREMLAMVSV